ncbi:MAG: TetR/AcrR family transcriptional regulator [Chitinophagales bacterium]|nr:TetR/AcrR family transcriptional regulator [Chitinophagales bacterium]
MKRKLQINLAAQSMFNDRGYSATSMRDLAKVVGIEPASLYNHYSSKEHILNAICFDMAEQFFEALNDLPKIESPSEELENSIRSHIDVITKNIDASRVFFLEWKHLNEPSLSEFKQMRKSYEAKFVSIIKRGIKLNEFHHIDPKVAVFTLLSSLNAIYDLYKPGRKFKTEVIADNICHILLSGISKIKNK